MRIKAINLLANELTNFLTISKYSVHTRVRVHVALLLTKAHVDI